MLHSRFASSRFIVVLLVLVLAGTAVSAQEDQGWWGSYYTAGNTAFSVGLGPSLFAGGIGLDVYPGAEFIVTKLRPGNLFAIDIGVGARAIVGFWTPTSSALEGYTVFGGGPFASAHFGFRGLDFALADYLERLDVFSTVGVSFLVGGPNNGFGFSTYTGFNYFLTDNLAVSVAGSYMTARSAASIGVMLKLGPKEELGEAPEGPSLGFTGSLSGDMAYINFTALHWSVLGYGGFVADDASFGEGDGVIWRMAYPDEDGRNEFEYTRVLLRINADGSRWWRVEYDMEDATEQFEYLVDRNGDLNVLRFRDPASGEIVTHEPSDPDAWWGGRLDDVKDREELASLSDGEERIRVPAGTFQANRVTAEEEGFTYTWWYSEEVPGLLVKLEGEQENEVVIEGELLEILSGVESPWGPAW